MDSKTAGASQNRSLKYGATMLTFQFLNKCRRVRLIVPCLSALGCMVFAGSMAQGGPATTSEGQESTDASKLNTGGATASDSTAQSPTYLGDVQPIFMANCARCHNQQTRFVYNWLDYKTAYSDRWEIKRRIWDSWKGTYYKEAMPIANSPESLALTDDQRLTIKNWVDSGGVEGVPRPQSQSNASLTKLGSGCLLHVRRATNPQDREYRMYFHPWRDPIF